MRDLVTGTNLPVSVSNTNSFQPIALFANRTNAHSAVISANGQVVAYVVGNTQNFFYPSGNNAFWRDLQHGNTQPIAAGRKGVEQHRDVGTAMVGDDQIGLAVAVDVATGDGKRRIPSGRVGRKGGEGAVAVGQ